MALCFSSIRVNSVTIDAGCDPTLSAVSVQLCAAQTSPLSLVFSESISAAPPPPQVERHHFPGHFHCCLLSSSTSAALAF